MRKSILILIMIALVTTSVVLDFIGWTLTKPEAQHINPGGFYFKSPVFVGKMFGEDIAALFPAFVLSVCTLLGIMAHILYGYTQRSIKQLALSTFGPLLISPIILYSTYAIVIDHPDSFVAALMAFENGFFWQAMFEKRRVAVTEER